ncbi:MAG: DNA sulfur modification protein DndD [Bacteroidales bacterium]|nr:DNA sulfur modification protein DndD [Bacteroidales bacterium]
MKIAKITLTNFRIYKNVNTISFTPFNEKNISIIAGKNGYGKTTFLTSLIWVFYGKLMAQVEDKYRRDIKSYGGYEKFLQSLINKDIQNDFELGVSKEAKLLVEVDLTDLLIPSIPCKKVTIKRSYDLTTQEENLSILIDGIENELTKDVGYDVFINDFILPREIAKFFFFDAEKVVSLAEAKSKDELRNLSKAYSEVLGIKKYEELKKNLETLLTKLRRNGVSGMNKPKLDSHIEKEKEFIELIDLNSIKQTNIDKEIFEKKRLSDEIQEKLIREGNAITVEELKTIKLERDHLKQESIQIKSQLNKLMELAPLVIAGKKLVELREQLINEQNESTNTLDKSLIKKEIESFTKTILKSLDPINISKTERLKIEKVFNTTIKEKYQSVQKVKSSNILLGFTQEQYLNFEAIYTNIKGAYVNQLNAIVQEEKNNRVLLSSVNKQIKQAEARKDNEVAKKYREEKASINDKILSLTANKESLLEESGELKVRLQTTRRELSEYEKNFKLVENDQKKYIVTENLLAKITELIAKVKEEKKYALQKSLSLGLTKLMHKNNFITEVKVKIADDIMDIDLIGVKGNIINKDALSKGEQQLYATALLKALVDESGIEFPVFIDSPLQKFDKYHSQNIIEEFYPSISSQVVLLPLLEKELTQDEFILLQPKINKSFIINNEEDVSNIIECNLKEIFKELKKNVYTN